MDKLSSQSCEAHTSSVGDRGSLCNWCHRHEAVERRWVGGINLNVCEDCLTRIEEHRP